MESARSASRRASVSGAIAAGNRRLITQGRAQGFGQGEIRVLNSAGQLAEIIPFDDRGKAL
jgi:hypothetical protein